MRTAMRLMRASCVLALVLAIVRVDAADQTTAPGQVRIRIFRRDRGRSADRMLVDPKTDSKRGTATVWDGDTKLGELKAGSHELVVLHSPGVMRLRVLFKDDPEWDINGWLVVCTHPSCEVEVPRAGIAAQYFAGALDSTVLKIPAVVEEIARLRQTGSSARAQAVDFLNRQLTVAPDCGAEYIGFCAFDYRFELDGNAPYAAWLFRSTVPTGVGSNFPPGTRIPAKTDIARRRTRLESQDFVSIETYWVGTSNVWDEGVRGYRLRSEMELLLHWRGEPGGLHDKSFAFAFKDATADQMVRILAALWVFLSPDSGA